MKKLIAYRVMIPAVLLLVTWSYSFAQNSTARRIHFQRGRSSSTVRGAVLCGQTVTYVIAAKAGQKMSVHLVGRGAAFRLSAPSGTPLEGGKAINNTTEDLDETGDYQVVVECWKRRSSSYALEVVIQ